MLDSNFDFKYSDEQSLAGTSEVPCDNIYDHGEDLRGWSIVYVVGTVVQTFSAPSQGGLQAVLQTRQTEDDEWRDLRELTPAIDLSEHVQGKVMWAARMPNAVERYTRLVWRFYETELDEGSMTAQLVNEEQLQQMLSA